MKANGFHTFFGIMSLIIFVFIYEGTFDDEGTFDITTIKILYKFAGEM